MFCSWEEGKQRQVAGMVWSAPTHKTAASADCWLWNFENDAIQALQKPGRTLPCTFVYMYLTVVKIFTSKFVVF